jgi:diacylglycerol kinase family enzyme
VSRRRLWAAAALLLTVAAAALAIVLAIGRFPRGLSVLVCVALAAGTAWRALRRRGADRALWASAACLLLAGAVALVILEGKPLLGALVVAGLVGALAAARNAFRARVRLPRATPPSHPVLFYNPLSGGGKAERFDLADQARRRGIEPIELRRGDDLEALVRAAVRRGADGLAMAGGDGSQAIVAMIAAERDLPYACIPAGTRNHFALDLGVDRDDVVGALAAFTCGGERRVDLAEVNGRVFVNNVSLGLYAEALQRAGYREAKIRTLMNTVPDVLGPDGEPPRLRWGGRGSDESGAAVLVSNNSYRLGRALGSGTRPRLDRGLLGIAVLGPTSERRDSARKAALGMRQWSARTFEIDSDRPVPAGIDGEATMLDPPLRFRIRSMALRVRIAPSHPGASPSALEPDSPLEVIRVLTKFALGRRGEQRPQMAGEVADGQGTSS